MCICGPVDDTARHGRHAGSGRRAGGRRDAGEALRRQRRSGQIPKAALRPPRSDRRPKAPSRTTTRSPAGHAAQPLRGVRTARGAAARRPPAAEPADRPSWSASRPWSRAPAAGGPGRRRRRARRAGDPRPAQRRRPTGSATPRRARRATRSPRAGCPAGNATFAAICLAILAIPLSLQNGTVAGAALLLTLVSGVRLRALRCVVRRSRGCRGRSPSRCCRRSCRTAGGAAACTAARPRWPMTVLAALLGIGVHFLISLPGPGRRQQDRHAPPAAAHRAQAGCPRLLVISIAWTVLVVAGIVVAALSVGLRQ